METKNICGKIPVELHEKVRETVWGKEYFCDEGNVTAHIGHIRKKIELDPRNPVFIQTVRGIGYKFAKK